MKHFWKTHILLVTMLVAGKSFGNDQVIEDQQMCTTRLEQVLSQHALTQGELGQYILHGTVLKSNFMKAGDTCELSISISDRSDSRTSVSVDETRTRRMFPFGHNVFTSDSAEACSEDGLTARYVARSDSGWRETKATKLKLTKAKDGHLVIDYSQETGRFLDMSGSSFKCVF